MAPILEGKSIGWGPKKTVLKGGLLIWRTKRIRLGTKVESHSRTQFAVHQSELVPRKLDPGPWSKVGLRVKLI
jgi:hypothetical protein